MYAEIDGNNVKFYGTIWHGDGPYIVSTIKKLLAQKDPVNIHVHSPGGSVIDGNLIFNAIAKSKNDTTIIVDGLAASMMSIIMLAGKKVKMASNAFIMIHAPSGDQRGNAKAFEQTAKVLRSMESEFIKLLSARTGKNETDLKELMIGDNWFNATEALEEKLIDEIIDPILEDNSDMSAYQDLKLTAQLFAKYDEEPITEDPKPENTPKNQVEMKLSAESLTALGLKPDASEQDINAAIAANEQKIKDLTAKQATEENARAEKLINDGVAKGKILATERETLLADAKANYDAVERLLAKVPEKKNLGDRQITTHEAEANGGEKWTHADWRKNDTKGLLAMKATDPDRYKALCEASGINY